MKYHFKEVFFELKPKYLLQIKQIYSLEIENWALDRIFRKRSRASYSEGKIGSDRKFLFR